MILKKYILFLFFIQTGDYSKMLLKTQAIFTLKSERYFDILYKPE